MMDYYKKQQFLREVDLMEEQFEVKIADFGMSKILKSNNELTESVCGTPIYMAPQIVG